MEDLTMRPMFQGSIVALVTPFSGGKVDEAKLRQLVEMHVAQGTDGIVPCGTTGESPTLSHDEHRRVVEIVIEAARGRLHVIAGTGSNATSEAIDLTRHAKKAGATGALVVNPYYNRPSRRGIVALWGAANTPRVDQLLLTAQPRHGLVAISRVLAKLEGHDRSRVRLEIAAQVTERARHPCCQLTLSLRGSRLAQSPEDLRPVRNVRRERLPGAGLQE
jgi:hypothetical protein